MCTERVRANKIGKILSPPHLIVKAMEQRFIGGMWNFKCAETKSDNGNRGGWLAQLSRLYLGYLIDRQDLIDSGGNPYFFTRLSLNTDTFYMISFWT